MVGDGGVSKNWSFYVDVILQLDLQLKVTQSSKFQQLTVTKRSFMTEQV